MTRPSNRELKALSLMETGNAVSPEDFVDIGGKTFAGMLKKGWIKPAETENTYLATPRGLAIHGQELDRGRWKR